MANTKKMASEQTLSGGIELLSALNIYDESQMNQDENYVFVKDESELQGPFDKAEVRELLNYAELNKNIEFSFASDPESWALIYKHPYFQRRKPQVVSTFDLSETDQIYVLKYGQKLGPYDLDQVSTLIDHNEVIFADFFSTDHGKSWHHLYEADQFDRRKLTSEQLPHKPETGVFAHSHAEVENALQISSDHRLETDAIANLAYLENVKDGKGQVVNIEKYEEAEADSAKILKFEGSSSAHKKRKSPVLKFTFMFLLLGAVSFYFLKQANQDSEQRNVASKSNRKKAPVLKGEPIKKAKKKAIQRNIRKKKPTVVSRRKIQKNSRKVKRKMRDVIYNKTQRDDIRYDDASEPIVLDPIRSKLSKKTVNPESDYIDDEAEFIDEPNFDDEIEASKEASEDPDFIEGEDQAEDDFIGENEGGDENWQDEDGFFEENDGSGSEKALLEEDY